MIDPISALSVSLRQIGGAQTSNIKPVAVDVNGPQSFTSALADAGLKSVNTLKAGEASAISGLQGTMPVQQVVEAVMASEVTLHTALALRNKAVAAYQEVSRMHI